MEVIHIKPIPLQFLKKKGKNIKEKHIFFLIFFSNKLCFFNFFIIKVLSIISIIYECSLILCYYILNKVILNFHLNFYDNSMQ